MFKSLSLATLLSVSGFVTISQAQAWIGFMNVFENTGGAQGGYLWGSPWGVDALKTTITFDNPGGYIGDQLLLQPNFNAYADNVNSSNPADVEYWTDGAGGGNKFMEANTYVQFDPIAQPTATFAGVVDAYTLAASHSAYAFIKVLDPGAGWSLDVFETVDLSSVASFALAADLTNHQGKVLQLGFLVAGLNANPANEVALGSVSVTVIPEPSTYALLLGGVLGLMVWRLRRRRG
jgi:hypothetical protein